VLEGEGGNDSSGPGSGVGTDHVEGTSTSSSDEGIETNTGLRDTTSDDTGIDDSGTADTATDAGCGNGIIDAGESCDDAGESVTCDIDCTPVDCGDGLLNATASEQCDGGGESTTCNYDCTPADCGDGMLNVSAGEQCDDGSESAFCDVDCTQAFCGDGVFNATAEEQCDGAGRKASCNDDCTLAECGDGITNVTAGEDCDGGGESVSCNADCTLAECGDGVTNVTAGEDCDGGGESVSCNADCTLAECGDGVMNVTAGEDCDDAGPSVGCNFDCTMSVCGDSIVNSLAGEACDASDLAAGSCEGLGFGVGALSCDGGCSYATSGCSPAVPALNLSFSQVKRFDFAWAAVAGAEYYQLLESTAFGEPYLPIGGGIVGESISFEMPLHFRFEASYVLRACNGAGCTDSATVGVVGSLAEAVGYVKASNTETGDYLGDGLALSADGNTLAVGALSEDGNATGIGGNQAENSTSNSGAVYIFVRSGMGTWSQQAYVKASNTGANDWFGRNVALSGDGNTLAVGANGEDGNATGIGGNQADNSASDSGAAYVFVRDGMGSWSQQAYIKASNTGAGDQFSVWLELSGDGSTLAVTAREEDSNATGIGGNQADNSASNSGAVYVFARNGMGSWSQQAYIKASNTGANDSFGANTMLSGDGNTLAIGAFQEDSNATGIGGNQADNSAINSGAVYVFVRNGMGVWSQQAYLKASNTGTGDGFGLGIALSEDGNMLAVGAEYEDSNATGIDGDGADNSIVDSGAVYVFVRNGMGTWSQQAYVKASNPGTNDFFGYQLALSGNGDVLAVGSPVEDSNATGVGGNQADESASDSGAIYVFVHNGMGTWSQRTYIKASNTGAGDQFAVRLELSGDGNTLAVSAELEDSNATGVGGDQANNSAASAGAVYLY